MEEACRTTARRTESALANAKTQNEEKNICAHGITFAYVEGERSGSPYYFNHSRSKFDEQR